MLKRIFALLLSAVLLLGLLAGCSKNQPDGTNEQSPSVQPPAADTESDRSSASNTSHTTVFFTWIPSFLLSSYFIYCIKKNYVSASFFLGKSPKRSGAAGDAAIAFLML